MKNRTIKHIPNFITALNIMLGLWVLFINISQANENYRFTSCVLILIAVFLDSIDGKLARALKVESDMGKQLDSFADFVSFGIAPMAILLTHENFRKIGIVIYISVAFYAICGAYRLARYNIGEYHNYFEGLPITASGFVMILLNIILHLTNLAKNDITVIITNVLIIILSIMMISRVRIYRFGFRKAN